MSLGAFISCNRLAGVGEFMTPQSGTPFDLCEPINVKVAFYLRAIVFRGDRQLVLRVNTTGEFTVASMFCRGRRCHSQFHKQSSRSFWP